MARVTIRWFGIEEAQRNLDRFAERMKSQSAEVVTQAAKRGLELAKDGAPYLTGALRDSGELGPLERTKDGPRQTVRFTAPHAGFVHATHPTRSGFLRNALIAAGAQMVEAMKRRGLPKP